MSASDEAKAIANQFSSPDGSTDWDRLESGQDGAYFTFVNAGKSSAGSVVLDSGDWYAVAWRLATPHKRQSRKISREQGRQLAEKIAADSGNTITFRGEI